MLLWLGLKSENKIVFSSSETHYVKWNIKQNLFFGIIILPDLWTQKHSVWGISKSHSVNPLVCSSPSGGRSLTTPVDTQWQFVHSFISHPEHHATALSVSSSPPGYLSLRCLSADVCRTSVSWRFSTRRKSVNTKCWVFLCQVMEPDTLPHW